MAEEESLSPQTTAPTKIDEDSVGFRRNSTGKKVSSSGSEKAVPHYLRASTGSCHDLCKYGHKDSTEEKPRRPTPRRATAKPTDCHVSAETVVSLGKKKKKNSPYVTRSLESLNSSASADSEVRGEGKKTPLVKVKAEVSSKPLKERASASNERLGLGVISLKKEKSSSEKQPVSQKISKSPTIVTTSRAASTKVSPRPALNRVTSLNRNRNGSNKVAAPLEEREPTNTESYEDGEKIVYVVKTKAKDSVGSDLDQTEESCSREDEEKIVYVDETEAGAKHDSLDLDREIECVVKTALELNREEVCDQIVECVGEKASELEESEGIARGFKCVDKAEPENNASESNPSSSSSEYTVSESEADTCSENSESEGIENSESQDRNDKARAKDEDEKARKMRFRRGTVLEIQPEDNAPRRLRFRRGKVLDDQDVGPDGGRRRRYKRREIGREVSENGAEVVVLKHQDVQGKKDTQGLFNNVIEETASKLVESRKSKVKALVGAFETVISLQDGKPSSNNIAA